MHTLKAATDVGAALGDRVEDGLLVHAARVRLTRLASVLATVAAPLFSRKSCSGHVGPVGIEPTTRGLKVRCSAN